MMTITTPAIILVDDLVSDWPESARALFADVLPGFAVQWLHTLAETGDCR